MFAISHGLAVGLGLAGVAIVVLVIGLFAGSWARRGSSRKIIRDEKDGDAST